MNFDLEWNVIGRLGATLTPEMIDEVTGILYAPDPASDILDRTEICVVLGSRNCGYKAERAAELFGSTPGVRFVACGANLSVSGQPEAELIRDILRDRGVAEDRVLIDEHSTNTAGNLYYAEQLIAEHVGDPGAINIAIISSGFHRLHVLASLPPALAHAEYVSAVGPLAGPDTWHTNPLGRAVILHELKRSSFVRTVATEGRASFRLADA